MTGGQRTVSSNPLCSFLLLLIICLVEVSSCYKQELTIYILNISQKVFISNKAFWSCCINSPLYPQVSSNVKWQDLLTANLRSILCLDLACQVQAFAIHNLSSRFKNQPYTSQILCNKSLNTALYPLPLSLFTTQVTRSISPWSSINRVFGLVLSCFTKIKDKQSCRPIMWCKNTSQTTTVNMLAWVASLGVHQTVCMQWTNSLMNYLKVLVEDELVPNRFGR